MTRPPVSRNTFVPVRNVNCFARMVAIRRLHSAKSQSHGTEFVRVKKRIKMADGRRRKREFRIPRAFHRRIEHIADETPHSKPCLLRSAKLSFFAISPFSPHFPFASRERSS